MAIARNETAARPGRGRGAAGLPGRIHRPEVPRGDGSRRGAACRPGRAGRSAEREGRDPDGPGRPPPRVLAARPPPRRTDDPPDARPFRGGDPLPRRGDRREHRGVLLDRGHRASSAARRLRRLALPLRGGARGSGDPPRGLLARVPRPARPAAQLRRPDRVAHGAAEPGRGRPDGARLRAARVRQLLLRALPAARSRPLPAPGRGGARGRGARRRRLPRVLARAIGRPARRDRPHPSPQRPEPHRRRRRASGIPGHRARAQLRSLGPRDDGPRPLRRIARDGGPQPARLRAPRIPARAHDAGRGADGAGRGHERAGAFLPGYEHGGEGGRAHVLGGPARPPAHAGARPVDHAGADAAAAPRRLREHGQPHAGAGQHAPP